MGHAWVTEDGISVLLEALVQVSIQYENRNVTSITPTYLPVKGFVLSSKLKKMPFAKKD